MGEALLDSGHLQQGLPLGEIDAGEICGNQIGQLASVLNIEGRRDQFLGHGSQSSHALEERNHVALQGLHLQRDLIHIGEVFDLGPPDRATVLHIVRDADALQPLDRDHHGAIRAAQQLQDAGSHADGI